MKTYCHTCHKEVTDAPRVCPHCAAPNPTFEYSVTKPIAIIVAVVIALSIIADVLHSRKPGYEAGETYSIVKSGLVCLTPSGLTKAKERDGITQEEVEQLGCLPIAPDQHPQVKVLDQNETMIKVRVYAPNLRINNFQGWTASDNLGPQAEAAP